MKGVPFKQQIRFSLSQVGIHKMKVNIIVTTDAVALK